MSEASSEPARPGAGYWRSETGIFLALWLLLLFAGRTKLFRDAGTFWHTISGERVLQSGHLLYSDPFTFTWQGKHYIAYEWLGECAMALIHRIDGLDSLLLASATLLAALYTWVAHRFLRAGLHWLPASLLVMLVVAASATHFHARPHLVTIAFLGITMGFLVDREAGRISARRLGWLVPIYLVWTSVHGGMLGGLATMGLALAGWTLYRLLGRDSPIANTRDFLGFAALLAACAATMVLSPYGLWLPRTWFSIVGSETLTKIIVEHRPLGLDEPDAWLVLLLAGVYLAALFSTWPRWPRVCWLLPFVWLYLAFSRVRHAPLFAITAAVALADMMPLTRFASWAVRSGSDLYHLPPEKEAPAAVSWKPAVIPALAVAMALLLQVARVPVPLVGHGWAQLDPSLWPVQLLPRLREIENDPSVTARYPDGIPIFNDYIYGGFLIYHTPGFRVFVDDRCELFRDPSDHYTDQWLDEFVQAGAASATELPPEQRQLTASKIRQYEERFGRFPYALVQTQPAGGFDEYFRSSPEWAVVERTPTATLYQRKH